MTNWTAFLYLLGIGVPIVLLAIWLDRLIVAICRRIAKGDQ